MSGEDGGAAFPTGLQITQDAECHYWRAEHPGMSLRDYFAAMAMQGILQRPGSGDPSREAYIIADAMLKERKEQRG